MRPSSVELTPFIVAAPRLASAQPAWLEVLPNKMRILVHGTRGARRHRHPHSGAADRRAVLCGEHAGRGSAACVRDVIAVVAGRKIHAHCTAPHPAEEVVDDVRSRFVIEPLEPGFGYTLGNSLRRTLLSSIPGAAVTSIRVDGVLHEFTTIPGVKEDVTDLILNIKNIVVSSEHDELLQRVPAQAGSR